ncbi:unnamed protein product, partial [Phyllotreta striolata]
RRQSDTGRRRVWTATEQNQRQPGNWSIQFSTFSRGSFHAQVFQRLRRSVEIILCRFFWFFFCYQIIPNRSEVEIYFR